MRTSKTVATHTWFSMLRGRGKPAPDAFKTPPRRPKDAFHAPQIAPLRLPRGPKRTKTPPDACKTREDIPNKRASRLLLLRFLAPHQKVSKNLGFYRVFGSSALQKSAKKEAAQKWAPRGLQDAFWAPKSGPKRRPRGPQEAPKTPQDAPKTPPEAPRSLPSALKAVVFEAKLPKTRKCQKPL